MVKKVISNELTDFYNIKEMKQFNKKYRNPNFKNHGIKIPFRMLIVGSSGSGKTTVSFEVIKRMYDTFNHITLCIKSSSEPLYEYLQSEIGKDMLTIYENGVIPPISEIPNDDEQRLFIFDDLCLDKNQSSIGEYFIRGRKVGGGISCIYITQSYFKCPKIIRSQCTYIILKKISGVRDLKMILSDYSLGVSIDEIMQKYKTATKNKLNFLLIDVDAPDESKFRLNFLQNL